MTEEIKEKLRVIYNDIISPCASVYEVISEYFTEDLTDFQVTSFETFLNNMSMFTVENVLQSSNMPISTEYDSATLAMPAVDSPYADILDSLISTFKENAIGSCPDILIRFPHVRVTNENNRHIDIDELYVKISLTWSGTMLDRFTMVRTSYDIIQWLSGYSHSHLPRVGSFPSFQTPCLGSGPIVNTIHRLFYSYDWDIWGLFCYELSKYVTVESLEGGPYFKLESVNGCRDCSSLEPRVYKRKYTPNIDIGFKDFVNYFVKQKSVKFAYSNGAYTLGESSINFWIRVSNAFIKWYNYRYSNDAVTYNLEELLDRGVLVKVYVAGGKVYTEAANSRITQLSNREDKVVLTFKGVKQNLVITGNNDSNNDITNNSSLLVSMNMCDYIISTILKLVNCNYGREENGETEAGKKCQYI